jgi:hypothetical protein
MKDQEIDEGNSASVFKTWAARASNPPGSEPGPWRLLYRPDAGLKIALTVILWVGSMAAE